MANVGNNARMAVRRTCPGGPFKPSFGLSGYRTVVHYELVYERLQYASRLPSVRWPNAEVYHDLRAVTRCRMTHSTLVCFERVLQSIYHLITPQATNINQVGNRFHLVKTIAQSVTPTLQTINPFANRSENGSEAICACSAESTAEKRHYGLSHPPSPGSVNSMLQSSWKSQKLPSISQPPRAEDLGALPRITFAQPCAAPCAAGQLALFRKISVGSHRGSQSNRALSIGQSGNSLSGN